MVSFPLPSYIVGHMTGGVSNVRRASPGQASAGAGVCGGRRLRGRASAGSRMRVSVRRALGEGAKVRFFVRSNEQNAGFREAGDAECAFP